MYKIDEIKDLETLLAYAGVHFLGDTILNMFDIIKTLSKKCPSCGVAYDEHTGAEECELSSHIYYAKYFKEQADLLNRQKEEFYHGK
jgi:hypothetical protein